MKTETADDSSKSTAASTFLALAGSKHKKKLGGHLNESASVGPNDFARKQLEKLGWKDGTGLGKHRNGISSHIRVHKRGDEQGGLGKNSGNIDPVVSADQWWKSCVGNTLAKLSAQQGKKSKKDKKKKSKTKSAKVDHDDILDVDSSDTHTKKRKLEYTDEELFEATGGARFGMRAQTQQRGKWKRAESNISEQEEELAKQKMEWDGLSVPRVVLSDQNKTKKSRKNEKNKRNVEEGGSTTTSCSAPHSSSSLLASVKQIDTTKNEECRRPKKKHKRDKESKIKGEKMKKKDKKRKKEKTKKKSE